MIRMILERDETSIYITRKIYRFFVNDQVNETHLAALAKDFKASNYDIPKLLKQLFTADWFYADENQGAHIKSPVELIVELNRTFGILHTTMRSLC